ncbi:MAG: mandelate racemase/muconate lactonizing enzyme family protein [Desulfobacterales bacterium]|jgi:L-alanine-DL-glutamate epimerase-like enolase superfamily enzyme
MSTVKRIELYHIAIPLPATFYPAWIPGFPQKENRFTLVRVTTDDGVEGYSAGPAMGRERAGLGELLGPYLIGEDAEDIRIVQQRLREIGYLGWKNAWIEPAFWDIKGKLAGKPVWSLLGGAPESRVRLYASTGEVMPPAERIEEAEARFSEGFRTIKLRVHDFDEIADIRQVKEVSAAIGHKMKIGVDANQGWRVTIVSDAPLWDLERARRFADRCADAGVVWLEEPLAMDAYDELAALTAYSRVPIAGGELHTGGLPELRMMIQHRCYKIFQPDAVFAGGIGQTIEVARLCRRNGLIYSPHTWTNGIGFAVNLQVFAASGFAEEKELEYPISPPGWTVEARDGILETPFSHDKGTLTVPDRPGLGFEIDPRALKKFGKRFFVMDRKRLAWFSIRNRGLRATLEINRNRRRSRKA